VSETIPEAGPLATAILSALDAALAFPVHLSQRGSAVPCLVLHMGAGDVDSRTLDDRRTALDAEFELMGIGSGPEQARWVADKARAALLGATIAVTGRRVSRARPVQFPRDVYADRDVSPPLWLAPVRYAVRTDPA
jgi:hypothetical protein